MQNGSIKLSTFARHISTLKMSASETDSSTSNATKSESILRCCEAQGCEKVVTVVDQFYPEFTRVICGTCKKTVGILLEGSKMASLDDILKSPDGTRKTGIYPAESGSDRLILYVLSQIIYGQVEPGDEFEDEFEFAFPPATDMAKIMWLEGSAVGFYTAKPKGSLDMERMQVYSMVTLDTIFVRTSFRRRGLASEAVEDLAKDVSAPNNIGFSYPISKGMLKVLRRHLERKPRDRERFWAISGCGLQGNCRNLWLIFCKQEQGVGGKVGGTF